MVEVLFFNKKSTLRAEEDRSIVLQELFSNLGRKRNETIPNLVRKRKGISLPKSHTEEKRSYMIFNNSKPHTEKGQSINSSRIPNLM